MTDNNGNILEVENGSDKLVAQSKTGVTTGEPPTERFFYMNRNTLPLKITLFLFYGAMSAILPYLTIHMRDIGISLSEIAIIYAVLPFTAFLGPPILGFLADKLGQYKVVLIIATFIHGGAHTSLLLVPKCSESPVQSSAVIEFNVVDGYQFVTLRPLSPSHCQNFLDSLRERQSGQVGDTENDDSIVRIPWCSWGDGGPTSYPLGSDIVDKWNIPRICRHDRAEYLEGSWDYAIPQFVCGKDDKDINMSGGSGTTNRTIQTAATINTDNSKCSVPIQLSGASTGNQVQQHITCQTDYLFDTDEIQQNGSSSLTFWLYFLIRVIANAFMNACFTLLDATALALVKKNKGSEYGKQRVFCVLGFALVSPLAGLLVDKVSASKGYTDYSAAFYVADGMLCLNIIGYLFMKLEVETPEQGGWKNAINLLKYPEVIVFLVVIFIMGNLWGFVESYLFIYLDELNAPKYLLGLTLTVGSLASVPFLYGAEGLVARVGRVNIIVMAFVVYFVRFFGYSYIPNAFWCFPFEAMEAFTYHLMWAAAATYCAILAPKGLLGTLTGVAGSLHYGLGKGSGAFIGGYVINMSSTRLAFRSFGIFAGVMSVVYALLNLLWLNRAIRKRNERDNTKKNEESKEPTQSMLLSDQNDQVP